MPAITLPADGDKPYGAVLRTAINTINDAVDDVSDPWLTYVPTYTNFTLGDGTVTARYKQNGKTVHVAVIITLGSTSTVDTLPRISLPVAAFSNNLAVPNIIYTDSGAAFYFGSGRLVGSTVELYAPNVASTYPTLAAVTATVPFTWVASDEIRFTLTYEAA